MAEGDDLLQKADALMRRHRAFVAGTPDEDPDTSADEGDVPILTEIVSADPAASDRSDADKAALRGALAREFEAWLDEELPQHVMRVLDGITDQMIMQLSSKARADLLPRLQAVAEAAPSAGKPAPARD